MIVSDELLSYGQSSPAWTLQSVNRSNVNMTDEKLEVIPLGGVGLFGMNMMAMRCGGEAIIVDAGMGFPEEDLPGVDIVIPDFSFIDEYRDEISAIILTHGHEDHIGAVPFLLKEINVPVYGTHLTLAFLESKLQEHGLSDFVTLHAVEPRDKVDLGNFEVEWIHVTHSLTSCTAVAITTPVGVVIHSGDFKVDDTPVIGPPMDLERLTEYGDRGRARAVCRFYECRATRSHCFRARGHSGIRRHISEGDGPHHRQLLHLVRSQNSNRARSRARLWPQRRFARPQHAAQRRDGGQLSPA